MNGKVLKGDGTVSGVTMPNASICNNAPVDGTAKAVDFTASV